MKNEDIKKYLARRLGATLVMVGIGRILGVCVKCRLNLLGFEAGFSEHPHWMCMARVGELLQLHRVMLFARP